MKFFNIILNIKRYKLYLNEIKLSKFEYDYFILLRITNFILLKLKRS